MLDLSSITTLIFDFGGVLIDLNRDESVAQFEALGVTNADKLLNNYVQSGIFLKLEDGSITPEQFRDGIRHECGKPLTDQQIDDAFKAFLLDVPQEKLDLLLRLKKKYRIFLLSNTNPIHFPWCAQRIFTYQGHTINDFFDHCYLSYEMKCSKPEPLIFEKLLADSKLKASECLLLDDGPKNCETAKELGFATYLVQEHQDLRPLFES